MSANSDPRVLTGVLTDDERAKLLQTYANLHELAVCGVPSVRSAARSAVAEVHAALDGQGLEFEYYSDRWIADKV